MLPTLRSLGQRFWLLIQAGVLREDAARRVSFNGKQGRRWFGQAGGVIPAYVLKPPGVRCWSFAEREEILAGVERGESI